VEAQASACPHGSCSSHDSTGPDPGFRLRDFGLDFLLVFAKILYKQYGGIVGHNHFLPCHYRDALDGGGIPVELAFVVDY
jgi:hypothetical protein